jgi:predicted enzyme related to lactoylglutathione lyase
VQSLGWARISCALPSGMCSADPCAIAFRSFGWPPRSVTCSSTEEACDSRKFHLEWNPTRAMSKRPKYSTLQSSVGRSRAGRRHTRTTLMARQGGGKPVAGVLDIRGIVPDADPPHWLGYFEVDDVDQMVAEAPSQDGRIVRPPCVPNFGGIAIGADATSAFMAWATREADRDPPRQPLLHSLGGAS